MRKGKTIQGKTYRRFEPDQTLLLPPSLEEWVPQDHLVRYLAEAVDQLDLSAIYGSYEGKGYPPYDPRLMVRVILYGYCVGVTSSRAMQRRLTDEVPFRFLAANQQPNHRTLSKFRLRHLDVLEELFTQVVHLAVKEKLVTLRHVSIDGTTVRANASRHKSTTKERAERELRKAIRKDIEQHFKECEQTDAREDELHGDRAGWELPPHLTDPKKRRESIKRALKQLQERSERKQVEGVPDDPLDEAAPLGAAPPPEEGADPAGPHPQEQYNFTDPDSRIMPLSNNRKAFEQCYNAQIAVDSDSQVIVALGVSQLPFDQHHLQPLLSRIELTLDRLPKQLAADPGYYSNDNARVCEQLGVDAVIAPHRVRNLDRLPRVRGRKPKGLSIRDRMKRKLRTAPGREIYRRRKKSVEPVFGQIKDARGIRHFRLRGLRKVRGEFALIGLTHNLLKLWRANVRARARPAMA